MVSFDDDDDLFALVICSFFPFVLLPNHFLFLRVLKSSYHADDNLNLDIGDAA